MKPLPLILLVLVCSVGSSFLIQEVFAENGSGRAGSESELAEEVRRLQGELDDLGSRYEQVVRKLESVELAATAGDGGGRTAMVTDDQVEAAVQRWMQQFEPELAAQVAALGEQAGEAGEADSRQQAQAWLAKLTDPNLEWDEREALWAQIREAGLLDETIAMLEEFADANPMDTDVRMQLTQGYYQKIYEAGMTPEAGRWAEKADTTLDYVLELDPQHWSARFSKAVGLSFAPPALGKQGEAIRHFEILLEQQNAGAVEPHHVQTYQFLGNMYQQMGNHERAREIWSAGLAKFPNHAELTSNLNNAIEGD